MSLEPKITFHAGVDAANGPFTSMVVVWYQRVTHDAILQEVTEALRDGVKQHFAEDEEFRGKVREAIAQAATALPLDVIVAAVKSAMTPVLVPSEVGSGESAIDQGR